MVSKPKPSGRPPVTPNADQQIRMFAVNTARSCFPAQASLSNWSDVKALAEKIEEFVSGQGL